MGKRGRNEFSESLDLNMQRYRYYLNRFKELSISRFKWLNMPPTCNARFLENALFEWGIAVYFEDEEAKLPLTLRAINAGSLNCYQEWTRYSGYGVGYHSRILTPADSVLIYNNMLHANTFPVAEMYARRLYQIDRTIDINAKAMRSPKVIKCNDKQRLSVVNFLKQLDGGETNIIVDSSLNLSDISVLDISSPYVCDKLQELKVQIWNEALTYLGISNSVVNKKERLITDEIITNQGSMFASRNSALEERQNACEKINAMFGTNIQVDFNDAMISEVQEDLVRSDSDE